METFTIYSKYNCPYCTKIKTLMELKHFPHKILNLDEDFTKDDFYQKFGEGSTFPQVIYQEQHLGGCSDTVNYLMTNKMI